MELKSVQAIAAALAAAKVKYLIVGGLAVNAHGYERLTRDVDLVIGLQPDNIQRGLVALIDIGYVPAIPVQPHEFADSALRESWRREKNMLVLKLWSDLHRRTPVDVFVYEPFDFPKEYSRALWHELAPDLQVPVVSYDALVEMKREAAREKDLLDIQTLEKLKDYRS